LKRSRVLLAFIFLTAGLTANAGLIGTDVALNYNFEGISTTDIFTVGDAVEVQCEGWGYGNANVCGVLTAPTQTIDFTDGSIHYTYTRFADVIGAFLEGNPNGFDFQFLNLGHAITEVELTTTILGLDASRLTFNANSIQLNMSNLALGPQESFNLRIVANPEPSAGLLAGLGGLLLLAPKFLKRVHRTKQPDQTAQTRVIK